MGNSFQGPFLSRRAITACSVPVALLAITLTVGEGAERTPKRETFFVVIYGAREDGGHPESSHCFATFAHFAEAAGADPAVELHHINWFSPKGHETGLPYGRVSADGHPPEPERGENRTTREALLLARKRGMKVTRWGPYQIEEALYDRALRHIDLLEGRVPGRRVLYKQLDGGYREDRIVALNCIHAISDIDRDEGPLRTGVAYGEKAARRVALHFHPWIRPGGAEHPREWEWIWKETWSPEPAPDDKVVRQGEP